MENTNNKTIKRTSIYLNEAVLKMIAEIKKEMGYSTDSQAIIECVRNVYFSNKNNK